MKQVGFIIKFYIRSASLQFGCWKNVHCYITVAFIPRPNVAQFPSFLCHL